MKYTLLLSLFTASGTLAQDSGTLTGRVLDHQNQPVVGISVRLTARSQPGILATTTEVGAFRFEGLKASTYVLSPVPGSYQLDTTRAETRTSLVFELRAGETRNIDLFVFQSGIITGTVRDAAGDPIQNVQVAAVQRSSIGHSGRWTVTASARTDDRGIYRIAMVPPGHTLVRVSTPNVPNVVQTFSRTFYGNTTERTRARSLDVNPGSELGGIDVIVVPVKTYTIRGRLLDPSNGLPVNPTEGGITVSLMETGDILTQSMGSFSMRDGTFTFSGLVSGTYLLSIGGQPLNGTPPRDLRALRTVVVDNADVTIDLLASVGTKLTGTARFEGEGPLEASVQLTLTSQSNVSITGVHQLPATTIRKDGYFQVTGLYPTSYFLRVSVTQGSAYVKSINGDAVNISQPILLDFSTEQHAEILLSTHTASISGMLPDAGTVAVWPAGMNTWNPNAIRTIRPKPDGTFTLEGLAPGKYHVAAWRVYPGFDPLLFDSAFLRQFESSTLELVEDDRTSVTLALVPVERIVEVLNELP